MFGWFGRKGAPEAMACAYMPPPWLAGGCEEGFARSYETQLHEVYRTNPVGLRAVRLVAGAIGGLTVETENEAAARLAKSVLESVGASLLLHGNAYVQVIADSRGLPRELALLRPERISIACDERGHASAYVYRLGGRAVRIAAKDALHRRQVAHIRGLNPADDHLGLGCLDAAIAAASIHNRASRWNKALLDNAARPSGALSYEPADGSNLSAEQFGRLKAELAEQFAGAINAGRPLLLDGGLKWQALALSPAEMVGQSIDQQLLGGGPRKGPRLGDLNVQTSSYGTAIPRIYGTMRVAGTIVWATDLKEDSELQGDGKSQPETVVYAYSVSLAVALSSRQAVQVKRIWADGKLIRGAAGDLKVAGKFRFYGGTEDQPVDPLIGSIEGSGQSPAYRGLALAMFEDLQLGPFGNRIPALTFELAADPPGGVQVGTLLNDASDNAIQCSDERKITGYAAHGDTMGGAVAPLIEAFAVELQDDGDALRSPPAEAARQPVNSELGASAEIDGTPVMERVQAPASSLPAAVTLTYYDPARDYQSGQVRASCPAPSRVTRALTLPCVVDAGAAKAMAENLLLRAWALRERVTVRLPLSFADLHPGSPLRFPELHGEWIAEDVEIERFVVTVTLRPAWAYAGTRSADPGRNNAQPDVVAAPTRLALFDLPDPETSQPTLALAAASPSGTWSQVPIEIETGGVVAASRTAIGEAVLGETLDQLADGQASLIDSVNSVEIELANPDHWLQSRDDGSLAMGANLAAIGNEIIQFGQAEPIGGGRFRLSRLLRGRRGSDWAMGAHAAGEAFCLIDAQSLKAISLPVELLGSIVTVTAHAPGDSAAPPTVTRDANGEAMRPLSPGHLRAEWLADGSLALSWVRRSRLAWAWVDEIEAPADGAVHGFRVRASRSGSTLERDVAASATSMSAADLAQLGAGPITIEVRQIGALGTSRPATLIINA